MQALREARRVLRPGGVLAAAAISRFASTYDGLLRGHLDEPGFQTIVERDLIDGQHRNPTRRPEWFTTAYFHLPDELGQEVAEAGLRLDAVLAVEGPGGMLPDVRERLADPVRRERVLTAIRRVEAEQGADLLQHLLHHFPPEETAGFIRQGNRAVHLVRHTVRAYCPDGIAQRVRAYCRGRAQPRV